ncbi:hypothetical protein [Alteribacillus iranensis]|uniref:Uncharacterized protein n=1 Tax=Alteribacillus iranensis TaxID=930128 RepID=A0A1I1ZD11_9BACI|nr:hypothetical protein [Alteribacillus iranensis]SFE28210.1 hypothetical protein SAMN05192532_101107 [Alteribacillus iranensis]
MTKKIIGSLFVISMVFTCGAFMNEYVEQKRLDKFHSTSDPLVPLANSYEGKTINLEPREYATIKSLSS